MFEIINFHQLSDSIASSGQPSKNDFTKIAREGYKTLINLALTTSSNAIVEEGDIVTELGMTYVNVPILWERPTKAQFDIFATLLKQFEREKVWVHCALNMRVSAFLYLYNVIYQQMPLAEAEMHLHTIWQPNDTWQQFIQDVLHTHNHS